MKALILREVNRLAMENVADPEAGPGQVRIALKAAALNRRDYWIKVGKYADLKFPATLGSDGAGVIDAVGAAVDGTWKGEEVIINPSFNWGADERSQGPRFHILGMPQAGTLAECIVVPADQIAIKPKHLSWEEAAALPLAGLTGYRALVSRARVRKGDRVLITGIGGGVALFMLQFAKALEAEVWVTSGSEEKIAKAKSLGAAGGFSYNDPAWVSKAKEVGGFDVIVDSAGGAGFNDLLDVANPGGRIAFFGATKGAVPELVLRRIFWKQLTLLGTTMGSQDDWLGMLELVHNHKIRPVVSEVLPFEKAAEAFDRLEASVQFGKMVVRIAD